MTSKLLCIYHGGCDDGFGAAWAVRHALGDGVEFHYGDYKDPPPDVAGRDVLLVDFSYKYPVLAKMTETARSILVLDHHKTAQEELAPYPHLDAGATIIDFQKVMAEVDADLGSPGFCPVRVLFDMERSGAGIAWDFFHPGQSRPKVVSYLEDRDLWRKALPGGDEFTIALRSYPQKFDVWDGLFQTRSRASNAEIFPDAFVDDLIAEGGSIQRYYRLRVEEIKRTAYLAEIRMQSGGELVVHTAWIANAPYFAASEVAGELAALPGGEFGACYFESAPNVFQYSLRSRGDFDVSAVAKFFGGGGHAGAAGFNSNGSVSHRAIVE